MGEGVCRKCFASRTLKDKAEKSLAECDHSLSAARKAIKEIVAAGEKERQRRDGIENQLKEKLAELEKEIEQYRSGSC